MFKVGNRVYLKNINVLLEALPEDMYLIVTNHDISIDGRILSHVFPPNVENGIFDLKNLRFLVQFTFCGDDTTNEDVEIALDGYDINLIVDWDDLKSSCDDDDDDDDLDEDEDEDDED